MQGPAGDGCVAVLLPCPADTPKAEPVLGPAAASLERARREEHLASQHPHHEASLVHVLKHARDSITQAGGCLLACLPIYWVRQLEPARKGGVLAGVDMLVWCL